MVFIYGCGDKYDLKAELLALVFALLLLACACFAGFDTFAFAFAIGDGDGHMGVTSGILLIGTLAGGVGLVVAAFGSWSERRAINLIALVSALLCCLQQCFTAGGVFTPSGTTQSSDCTMLFGPGLRPFCHH
jgi:hypothetical protein